MSSRLQDLDARLTSQARVAESPGLPRTFAGLLAHTGDSWFWFTGLAILYLAGSPYWKLRAAVMLVGILVTAVVVMTIKFTIRRERPAGEWGEIYRKSDPHSFPSGHAARAANLVTLAFGLGPLWLGVVLLVWAPLMAYSRVMMGLHYISDILGGFVAGAILGLLVLLFF
jgi:membrane-associated phospholipid phosphatase